MSYYEFIARYNMPDNKASRAEYRLWLSCM